MVSVTASVAVFPSGPLSTNAIVVSCDRTAEALIIDPAPGSASAILSYLEQKQLTPKAIVLTHTHLDHIGDVAFLQKKLKLPVWAHRLDAPNMEQPGSDGVPLFFQVQATKVDSYLEEGEILSVGDLRFLVLHTPGHSPGGLCFHEEQTHILISGDTLFQGSIGNLSLPTADPEAMWNSLEKLAQLPPQTKVYPGHGEATSIGEEAWLPQARKIFSY